MAGDVVCVENWDAVHIACGKTDANGNYKISKAGFPQGYYYVWDVTINLQLQRFNPAKNGLTPYWNFVDANNDGIIDFRDLLLKDGVPVLNFAGVDARPVF